VNRAALTRLESPSPRLVSFEPKAVTSVALSMLVRVALVGLLLGNLGRIPAFSTGDREVPILLNDLLVAMLLAAGVLRAIAARSLRLDSVAALALLFAAIGGASTLWSIPRFGLTAYEVVVSLSYLARWLFYFGLYVVFINVLRVEDVRPIWRTLETILLIFAAFGILQSLLLPNFAQLVYPNARVTLDWDPQGHRLVSTWLDPVFAGAFIMLGLLIQLSQISVGSKIPGWKPSLLTIAMLLTASRAAVIAAAVGAVVILLARGLSKRLLRIGIALTVFAAAAVPAALWITEQHSKLQIDESAMKRFISWARALNVFVEHPIIGIGFNAWGFVQERYGYERLYAFTYALDGGLIFIALMTGVVGLGVYLAMLFVTVNRARRIWSAATSSVEHKGLAIGVTAGTVALVVDGLFGNSLFLPFLMEIMWLLWALVFVAYTNRERRQARR
jgi:O-antigen ligase